MRSRYTNNDIAAAIELSGNRGVLPLQGFDESGLASKLRVNDTRQARFTMDDRRRRRVTWQQAVLLAGFGVVIALVLIELTVRTVLYITWRPFSETTGDYGTRRNGWNARMGEVSRPQRPLVLALGDSYTYGDGVDDGEAWPSLVEELTDRRVINAGVSGYGLDQTVLRAEQLAAVYTPDIIIVSFIPDDVVRCQLSYFSGHPKPYFEFDDTGLHLHPAPVPPHSLTRSATKVLGLSRGATMLFERVSQRRLQWDGPQYETMHTQGINVACLLMERLFALGQAHGSQIILLSQPQRPVPEPADVEIARAILMCGATNHLLTFDLSPLLERVPVEKRQQLWLDSGHMNGHGNYVVAKELARFLGEHGILGSGFRGVGSADGVMPAAFAACVEHPGQMQCY